MSEQSFGLQSIEHMKNSGVRFAIAAHCKYLPFYSGNGQKISKNIQNPHTFCQITEVNQNGRWLLRFVEDRAPELRSIDQSASSIPELICSELIGRTRAVGAA